MVRSQISAAVLLGMVLVGSACKPHIEGRPSLIDGDRVLAVRSTPAEAKPGAEVEYQALYVGPDGSADPAALDWAACMQRKPLAATGPIAPTCLAKTAKALVPLGLGESAKHALSMDVCKVFGPTAPEQKPGEPPSRPADPDTTGGYYQPVRVLAEPESQPDYSAGVTRLDCGLSGANQEQASSYAKQHRPNENPALESLVIERGHGREDTLVADDPSATMSVAPGAQLSLRARWASCPKHPSCGDAICSPGEDATSCADDCAMPHGCTGSEPYLALDLAKHALAARHEAIRVSWFATDGSFEHERTGRKETDAGSAFTDNQWAAPTRQGAVFLWAVIRDDRGGVGWSSYALKVQR